MASLRLVLCAHVDSLLVFYPRRWGISEALRVNLGDGITVLENKRGSVALVDLLDYAAAKKEGRIAIDGKRVLSVYVCEDCVKDRANVLSKAWQIAKARTLLAKLSAK